MTRYTLESNSSGPRISLKNAALIAGLGVLLMALTVPIVEFYIFPKLINFRDPGETLRRIAENKTLFSTAIFIHFITVVCDVAVTWALYIFLKPAHKDLSLLTAWLRLVYTAFNVAALLNLIHVLNLMETSEYFGHINEGQVSDQVLFYLRSFNLEWRFGLIFFGIYLCLLGYLVFISGYVPRLVGAFLVIAGLGYLVEDTRHFFFPDFNTGFLWFTFLGELVFMFWLLIRGTRIRVPT